MTDLHITGSSLFIIIVDESKMYLFIHKLMCLSLFLYNCTVFLSYGLNYLISSFKIEVGLNKAHNPPVGLSSSPWAIFSIHL